jgi:hypothetical protein
MRWLLLTLTLIGLGLWMAGSHLKGYPQKLYSGWINGSGPNKYYSLPGYKKLWLAPISPIEIPPYKEDYGQLWKQFPLRNSKIPLPIRHPLFQTIPIIEEAGGKSIPQLGMIFQNPGGRELSRIYTMPTSFLKDHSQGQDLFKLPFVRNRLLKLSSEKVWKDLFTVGIGQTPKTLDEMIYNLYILHLRSKVLPTSTIRYGLLKDEKAIVEIVSKNKDYILEMVLSQNNGSIYSYILRTEVNNEESMKLRSKFLESIEFGGEDIAMAKFLYKEFKQLNFARQVDQEGMLYLFSAWSQGPPEVELLKEMIFFLERGQKTTLQLKPLYAYAMKKFGKTFSTRDVMNDSDDPNVALQRKIEIESREKTQEALKEKERTPVEPDMSPEEKMNHYLKKAKEKSLEKKGDMIIH